MQGRGWATMVGLAFFALVAVACSAYLLTLRQADVYGVAAAVGALAIGQLALVMIVLPRQAALIARSQEQGKLMRALADRTAAAEARLTHVDQALSETQADAGIIEDVRTLRESLAGLARDIAKPAAAPATAPAPSFAMNDMEAEDAAPVLPQAPPSPQASVPPREHLEMLLEPVVELNSGSTMHYRAQLAMVGGGAPVDHAALMAKAEAGGMRAALELHLLRQSLPVLRRLRLKHPNMRMFLQLGAATLNSGADLDQMMAALEIERDVAQGVVFDLNQADLSRLETTGVDGLAKLGRAGALMALSHVAINGLDLASLRQLGVRYLDIDATGFDAGFGASPAWKQFSQFARAMQFQLLSGNVVTAQQATAAARVARFGYGPFFAPPRRVKPDAGQTAAAWAERAA